MRRIANGTQVSTRTAVAAVGTPGYANTATPGIGVTPTNLGPDDWNVIQEELMSILTAASIAPDNTGASVNQVLTAIQTLSGINIGYQKYTTAGAVSFTVPANIYAIKVTVVGGGGAGGSSAVTNSSQQAVAPGGNGGTQTYAVLSVTPGQVITGSVGAGGTPGAAGYNAGGAGGTTTFGSLTAPGGHGAPGGSSASSSNAIMQSPGVVTNVASGGVVNGAEVSGGIGSAGNGGNNTSGGKGGDGPWGGGGSVSNGSSAGNAGIAPGAAGSGANSQPSAASGFAGGAGAAGAIIIEWGL